MSSEEHLQLLAAAADANAEVEFERTEFEHSLEQEFEDRVRQLALQDVMQQKDFYASNLGLELPAINFFYAGILRRSRAMPMAAMRQEPAVVSLSSRGGGAETSSTATVVAASTFDEVEYQTSVTVVFEIVNED